MHTTLNPSSPSEGGGPVEAARCAIWRLFREGYVDEDMATAGLLAVDLGTRRTSAARLAEAVADGADRTRRNE